MQGGQDVILFAHSLVGPFDGDMVIASVSLHPALVIFGAPVKHVFIHHRNAQDLAEEIDHLFGARQTAQVAMDDDAVEAVVYKNQQAGKQLYEEFHRSSVLRSCLDNSIIGQATGGIKISNMFG